MIIGIDSGALGVDDERLKVGVYRMSLSLIKAITLEDRQNKYILYSFNPIDKKIMLSFGGSVVNKVLPKKGFFKVWLPISILKDKNDCFLGLSQSLPKLPRNTKGILFVHDLSFAINPKWFPKSYTKMAQNTKNAIESADNIVAVSKATKKDIIKIFHTDSNKIAVIYEGYDDRLTKTIMKKPEFKIDNYFLFVGTYKPSKNIPNLLKAFAKLVKENKKLNLVLVGSDYWHEQDINKIIKDLKLSRNVKSLGFIDDNLLAYLYSNAVAFVSPSFNEGFGLTFLEAARFKLPIITSDKGSIKEVLGGGALYTDPDSAVSIYNAMTEIYKNDKARKKLITKASENIKKFSWKKSAGEVLKIINAK